MTLPLLYTVGLHSYTPGADDGYGNPLREFAPPKDEPGTQYRVHWFAIRPVSEPVQMEQTAGEDQVFSDAQLCTPAAFPATPYDLVDFDGSQYEVVGASQDFNHGPWWSPGMLLWDLRSYTG